MSDRTWNPVDARLYEEDWSKGARLVAGVILARCPDQYGVFDFPLGYIKDFFHGIFTPMELTGFFQEWEAANFARFYRDGKVIWIRAKWKRSGKPSENHWKGLHTHLEGFPEVREDFLSYYQPPSIPLRGGSIPPVNPDSESDSERKEENKNSLAPKPAGESKPDGQPEVKPKRPYIPIRLREANRPVSKVVRWWHIKYHEQHGVEYAGDIRKMSGQVSDLLKKGIPGEKIAAACWRFLDAPADKYTNVHNFDTFIAKASKWIELAESGGYEVEFEFKEEPPCSAKTEKPATSGSQSTLPLSN